MQSLKKTAELLERAAKFARTESVPYVLRNQFLTDLRAAFPAPDGSNASALAIYRATFRPNFPPVVVELAQRLKPIDKGANFFEQAEGCVLLQLIHARIFNLGPQSITNLTLELGFSEQMLRNAASDLAFHGLNNGSQASSHGRNFKIVKFKHPEDAWELVSNKS